MVKARTEGVIAIVAVMVACFFGGAIYGWETRDDELEPDMRELAIYRLVERAMEDVGAHEWCELVLTGKIVPTRTEREPELPKWCQIIQEGNFDYNWNGGAK